MPTSFPADLARHIRAQLIARNEHPPSEKILRHLFEILHFASLRREESQPIACRIAFLDRNRPDPYPPERVTAQRWRYFTLTTDLPLDIRNLAKLSSAVDPWGSTLAVDIDSGGKLRVWGLVDQSVHYSKFVAREASTGVEMPGMFQAVIQGVGEVAVYKTYVLLGALKKDRLVKAQTRVLQAGPVHSKLLKSVKRLQTRVRKRVGDDLYDERDHWDGSLEELWISALSRILIGIHRYQHGGALLISDTSSGLKPKYRIDYGRLADALFRLAVLDVEHTSYSDRTSECYDDQEATTIPIDLYLDETVSQGDLRDTEEEVTGCIRFLTSLSRVDGLIWMDSELRLKGFGTEITVRTDPAEVFSASTPDTARLRRIDLTHYGTRHRSMLRYCAANPDSIGFVISQDDDVRAVTAVEDQLIMWDNIRLFSLKNSRRPLKVSR